MHYIVETLTSCLLNVSQVSSAINSITSNNTIESLTCTKPLTSCLLNVSQVSSAINSITSNNTIESITEVTSRPNLILIVLVTHESVKLLV